MTRAAGCFCGNAHGVRLYPVGWRCAEHTPAALADHPEPDAARYCAPHRCYCGTCPWWIGATPYADGQTIVDVRAIASGKRRASLTAYRDAQAATRRPA
jgi:hypothetical protein